MSEMIYCPGSRPAKAMWLEDVSGTIAGWRVLKLSASGQAVVLYELSDGNSTIGLSSPLYEIAAQSTPPVEIKEGMIPAQLGVGWKIVAGPKKGIKVLEPKD